MNANLLTADDMARLASYGQHLIDSSCTEKDVLIDAAKLLLARYENISHTVEHASAVYFSLEMEKHLV